MLTERQMAILNLLIKIYTAEGAPIGSKRIVEEGIKASSATIRNELSALEKKGLIQKEHTSSGRVPSIEGFRYFAEFMLDSAGVSEHDFRMIYHAFEPDFFKQSDILKSAANVLAELTGFTAFVLSNVTSERILTGFSIIPLNTHAAMAVLITDNTNTTTKFFNLPKTFLSKDLKLLEQIVHDRLLGNPLLAVHYKIRTELPQLLHRYFKVTIGVMPLFEHLFEDLFEEEVFVSGKLNALNYIDSADSDALKRLYQFFGETDEVASIIREITKDRLTVDIGDGRHSLFQDLSLITQPYDIPGNKQGIIAMLGPVNLDYVRIVGMMSAMSKLLSLKLYDYDRYVGSNHYEIN
ncbi:MAG: heat-inducible transcriptional repressor HrcA [Streptococcaceae bacterium]|jgi:heat-inducible transcriptional repressor|nr:heat-inducible transcriptional repressor HrcA [Streptococcaceae bacterium]